MLNTTGITPIINTTFSDEKILLTDLYRGSLYYSFWAKALLKIARKVLRPTWQELE